MANPFYRRIVDHREIDSTGMGYCTDTVVAVLECGHVLNALDVPRRATKHTTRNLYGEEVEVTMLVPCKGVVCEECRATALAEAYHQ